MCISKSKEFWKDADNPNEGIWFRISAAMENDRFSGFNLNSITYIQFLVECEEVFEIEIDDDELDIMNFTDVQSVIDFIVKKMKE